jgi:hypothetical protein
MPFGPIMRSGLAHECAPRPPPFTSIFINLLCSWQTHHYVWLQCKTHIHRELETIYLIVMRLRHANDYDPVMFHLFHLGNRGYFAMLQTYLDQITRAFDYFGGGEKPVVQIKELFSWFLPFLLPSYETINVCFFLGTIFILVCSR